MGIWIQLAPLKRYFRNNNLILDTIFNENCSSYLPSYLTHDVLRFFFFEVLLF